MAAVRIIAIALIVVGGVALFAGEFPYAGERQDARLGALEISVVEQKRIDIPVWASLAVLACGAALLLVRK